METTITQLTLAGEWANVVVHGHFRFAGFCQRTLPGLSGVKPCV